MYIYNFIIGQPKQIDVEQWPDGVSLNRALDGVSVAYDDLAAQARELISAM